MEAPPNWATRLLRWFCDPDLIEDLEGDLLEIFQRMQERSGLRRARMLYSWLVLRSLRPSAMKKNQLLKNSKPIMIYGNIKIALRVLLKDWFNTSMNLLGLGIGIFCFLLLGAYVQHELSFDQFHSKKERLYRVWLKEDYGNGKVFFNAVTPLRFETLLEENFPETEHALQYMEQNGLVGEADNQINEKVAVLSPEFFQVFDFELLVGSKTQVVDELDDVVISRAYALKYFGSKDPIGQPLAIQLGDDQRVFTVAGIFKDIPQNSSIQFDIGISNLNNRQLFSERALMAWFNVATETYLLLKPGARIEDIDAKMQDVVMSLMGDATYGDDSMERDQYQIGFQKMTDIHLDPSVPLGFAPVSNPQYIMILGAIGLLVLVIACVNYTSIATGQSLRRSKEVGIRKSMGAHRMQLVMQYLTEGILLTFIAITLAAVATFLTIPFFNKMVGIDITPSLHYLHLLVALVVGILAGIYPALVAARSEVVQALHATTQSSGKLLVRKALMIIQFAVTVFLISSTLIMRDQIQFLLRKDLGYDYSTKVSTRLVYDPASRGLGELISSGMQNGEMLKSKLEQYPQISGISMGTHMFGTPGWAGLAYTDENDVFRRFNMLVTDAHFLGTFDIQVIEGRDFQPGNGLDERQSVIINEAAAELFDLDEPVGKKLPGSSFGEHQIIGMTRDFHFNSLHTEISPLVIVQNARPIMEGISDVGFGDSPIPKLVFTYNGSNLQEAPDILKEAWESTFPNEQLNFQFLDQRIQEQYESEMQMQDLVSLSTGVAVLIAALGLLGLSMLVVSSREKEIGIRKVMGATPRAIFGLIARGFWWQILIAIVLSVPLTYWIMSQWLENFAYRTPMNLGPFLLSGLLAFTVAGLVMSYHTIKASLINPIESLREE